MPLQTNVNDHTTDQDDAVSTMWAKTLIEAKQLMQLTQCTSPTRNLFVRLVLCQNIRQSSRDSQDSSFLMCDLSTLHIVRPAVSDDVAANGFKHVLGKLLSAGGHCMEYTTKQPTAQREQDQKDESKTHTNDGSRVSVGRISRLLLPGLQSSLLPLLGGNCKSFFWVRINVQSNHQKKSVLPSPMKP